MRQDNERKVRGMTREELEQLALNVLNARENARLRKTIDRRDEAEAERELAGEQLLPIEMPTQLDAHVRVENDDGSIDWKTRDDASVKEHLGQHSYRESLHQAAAGIRRRKHERLSDWTAAQGSNLDHGGPIGDYIWREVRCAICGRGPEKIPELGTFVEAHRIAVKFGGGDGATEWAHKLCNEKEGVG